MQAKLENGRRPSNRARGVWLLALGAGVALLASECSNSHVQETVTVAPRAMATPARAPTYATSSSPPAIDAETEAAGDALAHAIVALKNRRRDEALRYMNLARARLTHCLNHATGDANENASSNSTREHLNNDLRELDAAERSAHHNAYDQSRMQLIALSHELDQVQ